MAVFFFFKEKKQLKEQTLKFWKNTTLLEMDNQNM